MADFWFDNSLFVGKDWRWRGAVERVKINIWRAIEVIIFVGIASL
jgi:hypothetical protein